MESVKVCQKMEVGKCYLKRKTEMVIESVGGNSNRKIEVLKMFALNFLLRK